MTLSDAEYPFTLSVTAPSPPCSELVARLEFTRFVQLEMIEALTLLVREWLAELERIHEYPAPVQHFELDQASPLSIEVHFYHVAFDDQGLECLLAALRDVPDLASVEIE